MSQKNAILVKRARAKFLSSNLSLGLASSNPDSILTRSYWNSYHCCNILIQEGKSLTSRYCKNRWCAVCNRIRTAKLINGYLPCLSQINDLYFITLTCKTVTAVNLPCRIDYMLGILRSILNHRKGRRMKISGVRKLECTIRPNGHYHPHFHLVVETEQAAQYILDSWLSMNADVSTRNAQDIRKADDKSLKELFKYFTKVTSKNGDICDYKRLDVVFRAMKGKRVYQPFGGIKMVSEDIEELTVEQYDYLENCEQLWKWNCNDWVSEYGELLTGYVPSSKLASIFT